MTKKQKLMYLATLPAVIASQVHAAVPSSFGDATDAILADATSMATTVTGIAVLVGALFVGIRLVKRFTSKAA